MDEVDLKEAGWVSQDGEYTLLSSGSYELVIPVGGNTVVEIWTDPQRDNIEHFPKSVELIVRHEEGNKVHQIYFRVLVGGQDLDGQGMRDVAFMRVHSLDGRKQDRNVVVGETTDGFVLGVPEDIYECSDIDTKPTHAV